MEILFWVFLFFLLLYEPIFGYFDFQKFKKNVETDDKARIKYYINTFTSLWTPTIFIMFMVFFTDISFKDIGFNLPSIQTEVLGVWISFIFLIIGVVYFVSIAYFAIGYHLSEKIRQKLINAYEKDLSQSVVAPILPVTKKEKRIWNYISLTAGVTEEIIYRGFLLYILSYLFPSLSIFIIVILSGVIFGLAHTYQGFLMGVIRTSIFGAVFSILYIVINSIIPLILFHFLVDYIVKLDGKEKNR